MTFEGIVGCYESRLRSMARRLARSYASIEGDDLFQEGIIHLWRWGKTTLSPDDFSEAYVVKGCYFAMKNYIRTCRRRLDRNSVSMYQPLDTHPGIELAALLVDEKTIDSRDAVDTNFLVENLWAQLPERERRVCELGAAGYTTRQIGAALGISHVMVVKVRKKIAAVMRQQRDNS